MPSGRLVAAVAVALLAGTDAETAQSRECLHGQFETPDDRARREQAVELAHDVNRAQANARRFRFQGGPYLPLDQLSNLPAAPTGFRILLHTDGTTYSVSIKDTLDPCRYAVFSDQSGDVYEAVPSPPRAGMKLLPAK